MTDRELLELAAKAAGYDVSFTYEYGFDLAIDGYWPHGFDKHGHVIAWWNPLADDGDRYRLAKTLGISILFKIGCAMKGDIVVYWKQNDDNDCESDTKNDAYAVVTVAAEIGRRMK